MAALGAWVAVMLADRGPVTIYTGPPVVIPDPVEDGGLIVVDLPVQRYRSCPGMVNRTLRNAMTGEIIAFYDPVPAVYPQSPSTDHRLPKTFALPSGLPDRVIYEADVCFVCNPLQHWFPICTKVPPVTFGVIPRR